MKKVIIKYWLVLLLAIGVIILGRELLIRHYIINPHIVGTYWDEGAPSQAEYIVLDSNNHYYKYREEMPLEYGTYQCDTKNDVVVSVSGKEARMIIFGDQLYKYDEQLQDIKKYKKMDDSAIFISVDADTFESASETVYESNKSGETKPLSITNADEKSFDMKKSQMHETLKLDKTVSTDICYKSDEIFIVALGEYNDNVVGPVVNTKEIVIYNHKKDCVDLRIPISENYYVSNAVPYNEGILYTTMPSVADEELGYQEWNVIYQTEKEHCIIDSGLCRGDIIGLNMAVITFVSHKPVYIYESIENGYSYGVRLVETVNGDISVKDLYVSEDEDCVLLNSCIESNGREFAYGVVNHGALEFHIRNELSQVKVIRMPEKISDYCLTDEYFVISTDPGDNKGWLLNAYHLTKDEKISGRCGGALYRLKKFGDEVLAIDSQFNLFSYTIHTDEMYRSRYSFDIDTSSYIYYPAGENQLLVMFYMDDGEEEYYMCVVSGEEQ